ncbi:nuclease [candidate division KSB1 bacterium]|nr:nuclease [candidate division KSB1 bacterium]
MQTEQKHSSPIKIVIDDREKNCATAQVLSKMQDIEIQVQRLILGDYEVDGKVLFERKTLVDLTASIKDGRLFRQGIRLVSSPLKCVLILEGTSRDLVNSKMRREAIQGALISISIILGIPILRSKTPEESARLMLYTAKQIQHNECMAIHRKTIRPKGKRRLQLHILQGLPRVGPERAARLLDQFGSVEAVISAKKDDLIKIPGIGQHLAKLIRWAVGADNK